MKTRLSRTCTRRPMVTFNQENRKIGIMNGNSTQMVMFSDMVKRELRMVLLWHSMLKGTKTNSQRLQSLRRPSRTTEQSLKISSDNQRIWDKAKPIEALTSFTVSKMFKVTILGMPLDASTVNQAKEKCSQMLILEDQSSQIAETLLERRRTDKDHLDALPSVKTFLTRSSEVLLITR